jgi:hypothetical protein
MASATERVSAGGAKSAQRSAAKIAAGGTRRGVVSLVVVVLVFVL